MMRREEAGILRHLSLVAHASQCSVQPLRVARFPAVWREPFGSVCTGLAHTWALTPGHCARLAGQGLPRPQGHVP